MNNLRKVCKKNSRITGVIIIVIGILVLLIWGRAGYKFLTAKTIDENTKSLSDYEGKLVTFHMTECWDWYEDITNPNGSNFTGWVTYNMTDKDTGDGFWFGVWRKTKYDDEMENFIYETRQYFGGLADEPKGSTVKGYLLKMDSDDKSYFDNIMGENTEKREYYQIIEGYLDDHGSKSITLTMVIDLICLAIVAVGVIVFLIGGIGWDKKLKTYVQMHPGLTMDMLEGVRKADSEGQAGEAPSTMTLAEVMPNGSLLVQKVDGRQLVDEQMLDVARIQEQFNLQGMPGQIFRAYTAGMGIATAPVGAIFNAFI